MKILRCRQTDRWRDGAGYIGSAKGYGGSKNWVGRQIGKNQRKSRENERISKIAENYTQTKEIWAFCGGILVFVDGGILGFSGPHHGKPCSVGRADVTTSLYFRSIEYDVLAP